MNLSFLVCRKSLRIEIAKTFSVSRTKNVMKWVECGRWVCEISDLQIKCAALEQIKNKQNL